MNGVFHITFPPDAAMLHLDGRQLLDKASLLRGIAQALGFPAYFGENWDALDDCLNDLSWHEGALKLLITNADQIPADLRASLVDIFAEAAQAWQGEREVQLYLM